MKCPLNLGKLNHHWVLSAKLKMKLTCISFIGAEKLPFCGDNFKSLLVTQFVIFKPLSHCFEETIGFDVKASFASRPVSRLISWYNKRILIKGYSVPRDFSWIENYKLNVLDLPSISPQSAISGFLDEVLEHKHLLNHVLPIFKNYFYKARESKRS